MAEYIEREALIKKIEKGIENCYKYPKTSVAALMKLKDEIYKIPVADVAKVNHGKWIRHEKDGAVFADYECSVCSAYPTGGVRSYYCPNCGAKMDKDE